MRVPGVVGVQTDGAEFCTHRFQDRNGGAIVDIALQKESELEARLGPVDPLDCPFPLRRQHMADALGLTGAHINRTLNRLRDDGVAVIENQRLAIRDFPRLAALAGTPA